MTEVNRSTEAVKRGVTWRFEDLFSIASIPFENALSSTTHLQTLQILLKDYTELRIIFVQEQISRR